MGTSCYLDKDESGVEVNQTMIRGMICSLLYLTASRPDIIQVVYVCVCVCARFQANPKESHLTTVKRILKYLKGTVCFGLWYPSRASPTLIGYSDVDYDGCKIDRKSTSGTCHLLGCSLVYWHSKKQACVALSTTQAKYIAASNCCAQIL